VAKPLLLAPYKIQPTPLFIWKKSEVTKLTTSSKLELNVNIARYLIFNLQTPF